MRVRAAEVTSAEGKQQIIAELYEKFFKHRLQEAVRRARHRLHPGRDRRLHPPRRRRRARGTRSGAGLTDEGVHILDPFTGTGTFIVRLLQSGLITPDDLARKYASELHANEIMLLAYYIAAVNIETTYHALIGQTAASDSYEPFAGIVLTDTFQITEDGDSMDAVMFPQNNERIERQNATPITVIVGNPPYSVGQTSRQRRNANVEVPDARRAHRRARTPSGRLRQLKNSLYDSYIRAFRWATDRIGDAGRRRLRHQRRLDRRQHRRRHAPVPRRRVRPHLRLQPARQPAHRRRARPARRAARSSAPAAATPSRSSSASRTPTHTRGRARCSTATSATTSPAKTNSASSPMDSFGNVDWQTITPNAHGDWIKPTQR